MTSSLKPDHTDATSALMTESGTRSLSGTMDEVVAGGGDPTGMCVYVDADLGFGACVGGSANVTAGGGAATVDAVDDKPRV
jgi:hypothetical protein